MVCKSVHGSVELFMPFEKQSRSMCYIQNDGQKKR